MNTRNVLVTAAGVALIFVVGSNGHVPGDSSGPPAATASADGCQVNEISSDGTPPPGTPHFDASQLCGALHQAENDAACMGDWQPPNPDRVNAREMCIELHRRGCGDPSRDCDRIPPDQTYYTHH